MNEITLTSTKEELINAFVERANLDLFEEHIVRMTLTRPEIRYDSDYIEELEDEKRLCFSIRNFRWPYSRKY